MYCILFSDKLSREGEKWTDAYDGRNRRLRLNNQKEVNLSEISPPNRSKAVSINIVFSSVTSCHKARSGQMRKTVGDIGDASLLLI